jgi:hypothetical protein
MMTTSGFGAVRKCASDKAMVAKGSICPFRTRNGFEKLDIHSVMLVLGFLDSELGNAKLLFRLSAVCKHFQSFVYCKEARTLWRNVIFSMLYDQAARATPGANVNSTTAIARRVAVNPAIAMSSTMLAGACGHVGLKVVTVFCKLDDIVTVVDALLANCHSLEVLNMDIRLECGSQTVGSCLQAANVRNDVTGLFDARASCVGVKGRRNRPVFEALRSLSITCMADKRFGAASAGADMDLLFDIQLLLLEIFGRSISTLSLSPCADRFLRSGDNASRCASYDEADSGPDRWSVEGSVTLSQLCPALMNLEIYSRMQLLACNLLTSARSLERADGDSGVNSESPARFSPERKQRKLSIRQRASCANARLRASSQLPVQDQRPAALNSNDFRRLTRFRYVNTAAAEDTSEDQEAEVIHQQLFGVARPQSARPGSVSPEKNHDADITCGASSVGGGDEEVTKDTSAPVGPDVAEEDFNEIEEPATAPVLDLSNIAPLRMRNLRDIEIEDNWSSELAHQATIHMIPRSIRNVVLCSDMCEHVTAALQSFSQQLTPRDDTSVEDEDEDEGEGEADSEERSSSLWGLRGAGGSRNGSRSDVPVWSDDEDDFEDDADGEDEDEDDMDMNMRVFEAGSADVKVASRSGSGSGSVLGSAPGSCLRSSAPASLVGRSRSISAGSAALAFSPKFANLESVELRDVCFVPIDERMHLNSIGNELSDLLRVCPEMKTISLPALRIESPVLRYLQQTNRNVSGSYEESSVIQVSAVASCC